MLEKDLLWDVAIPFDGELLTTYHRRGLVDISGEWKVDIHNFLSCFGYEASPVQLPGKCLRYDIDVGATAPLCTYHVEFQPRRGKYHIYEVPARDDPTVFHGVLLEPASLDPARMAPRDCYARLVLSSLTNPTQFMTALRMSDEELEVAEDIATLFKRELLLSTTSRDGWIDTGRRLFVHRAAYWIQRASAIKMALPAFPCKTTNKDKAAVSVPDGGEFEALAHLLGFCQKVGEVYEPGCELSIVSDGHVFSDCIGTDDNEVTRYSKKLKDMLREVQRHHPVKRGGIKFFDLEVLLQLDGRTDATMRGYNFGQVELDDATLIPYVNHPVITQINPRNDFCRRILMLFFAPPEVFARDLLANNPQHSLTALYRGFSRFMFEDLAYHPDFHQETTSQRKKAAERVALEMILRNQAYSRLVERVLLFHVRLSIHAHDTAGPKFPIQLLTCRPVDEEALDFSMTLKTPEVAKRFLHIPTPWHNTMAEIWYPLDDEGWEVETMTVKASSLIAAKRPFYGGYDRNHERGGRFVFFIDEEAWINFYSQKLEFALPEIAVGMEDFRLGECHDYTRPSPKLEQMGPQDIIPNSS